LGHPKTENRMRAEILQQGGERREEREGLGLGSCFRENSKEIVKGGEGRFLEPNQMKDLEGSRKCVFQEKLANTPLGYQFSWGWELKKELKLMVRVRAGI